MTPADREFPNSSVEESSTSRSGSSGRGKWTLTREALDKLLNHFSADRDDAGKQYEIIRLKLVRFFEWHSFANAEELTDETLNRVARRIDEGENVFNLNGYFYAVARLVCMEANREPDRQRTELSDAAVTSREILLPEDDEAEARLRCFDTCLAALSEENRDLILEYYQEEKRAKIDLRKKLAARLDIPLNALRIRVHRIRAGLENCIRQCLAQQA